MPISSVTRNTWEEDPFPRSQGTYFVGDSKVKALRISDQAPQVRSTLPSPQKEGTAAATWYLRTKASSTYKHRRYTVARDESHSNLITIISLYVQFATLLTGSRHQLRLRLRLRLRLHLWGRAGDTEWAMTMASHLSFRFLNIPRLKAPPSKPLSLRRRSRGLHNSTFLLSPLCLILPCGPNPSGYEDACSQS
jgi:hypothetical protein